MGQGWEEIRTKVARVALFEACGPRVEQKNVCVGPTLFAAPAVQEKVFTYNPADLAAGNKKYIHIYRPVRPRKNVGRPAPSKKKKNTVPSRRGKILPSRPAEGKTIDCSVPQRKKNTVPSRGREQYLPCRPVMKIYLVEFYRPVPPKNCAFAVPSRPIPIIFYVFILPSRCHFFPAKQKNVCRPVPPRFPVTMISLENKASRAETKEIILSNNVGKQL